MRATIISTLISVVVGHGSMTFPKPRNQYNTHSCAHCANGPLTACGGNKVTGWTADPAESDKWIGDYTSPRTYLTAGGTIEVEYYIKMAHKGHFVMEVCYWDGSAVTINPDCFERLDRVASDTTWHAYNPSKPTLAYFEENDCMKQHMNESYPMTSLFRLPAGKTAERAIIRWYWQTGNSCLSDLSMEIGSYDPSIASWKAPDGCGIAGTQNLVHCGDNCPTLSCKGEQFMNCADVWITDFGTLDLNKGNAKIEGEVDLPTTEAGTVQSLATTASGPLAYCQNYIEGFANTGDSDCVELCSIYAEDRKDWCLEKGYDVSKGEGLLSCVVYGQSCAD